MRKRGLTLRISLADLNTSSLGYLPEGHSLPDYKYYVSQEGLTFDDRAVLKINMTEEPQSSRLSRTRHEEVRRVRTDKPRLTRFP